MTHFFQPPVVWPESLVIGLKLAGCIVIVCAMVEIIRRTCLAVCGWLARRELRQRRWQAQLRRACDE